MDLPNSITSDTDSTASDLRDETDTGLNITHTQIVTCIVGGRTQDSERKNLRARLERERLEREQRLQNSFISTFRNLFRCSRN